MATATLLIVDAEASARRSLRDRLSRHGWTVIECDTAAGLLEQMRPGVDAVLLDTDLPDADGLFALHRLTELYPDTPVIAMAAGSSVERAVAAMKQGAYHYLRTPVDTREVVAAVERAIEAGRLRREVRRLRGGGGAEFGVDAIVGTSPAIVAVRTLLERIASSPTSTVLLTGETGTGKDLAARAIHYDSDRAAKPFLNLTCSALPEPLLESELFGHERGAFTDARQRKRGLLESADGGTVFLDEIGEMSPALQAKLLRVLEERTFRRVGGLTDIRVDVRIVAASNRDLEAEVAAGRFREDLFYRLQVMPVKLPPLRERAGDIARLAAHYVERYNREFGKRVRGLTHEAQTLLERYRWPGNVRELRNAIERAMLLADGERLGARDFAPLARTATAATFRLPAEGVSLEAVERQLVVQALERTGGNQTRAGRLLGINRDQVRYRIEKFGLARPQPVAPTAARA